MDLHDYFCIFTNVWIRELGFNRTQKLIRIVLNLTRKFLGNVEEFIARLSITLLDPYNVIITIDHTRY